MSDREKIGLFGGSFDPIHTGHLILAESARAFLGLGRVLFMPTAMPPHKWHGRMTDYSHRTRMVELAIGGNPSFELSTFEGEARTSYTFETVLHFKELGFGKEEIHLLVGSDSLGEISTWKNPGSIFENATIAVLVRPGFEHLPSLPASASVVMIETGGNTISSTEIRRLVGEGRSIRYLVPPPVERFIDSNALYRAPA